MSFKKLTVRGVEWEYATGGRGAQTILLFHGAVGGAETMQWLAERFADEYRTIAPTVADVRRLEEVCDAASAILDREHVGRAVVFGGSFGGLVAQAFLKRRWRQVEHLVLLSTGAPNRQLGARTERMLKLMRLVPFHLLRAMMKAELSGHLKTPVPPEHAARVADFRRRLDEYFDRKLTKETLMSRIALAADFNARETLDASDFSEWPGRALIIDSDDDPMVSAEDRRRLHALFPGALACTFEGAGHMIPLLRTEELVGVVKAFLKERYGPPPEHCPVAQA
jgi:pimeloyl-ACP methyl ester carboxylesterase